MSLIPKYVLVDGKKVTPKVPNKSVAAAYMDGQLIYAKQYDVTSDSLPIEFKSRLGTKLDKWSITGDIVQDGTPTIKKSKNLAPDHTGAKMEISLKAGDEIVVSNSGSTRFYLYRPDNSYIGEYSLSTYSGNRVYRQMTLTEDVGYIATQYSYDSYLFMVTMSTGNIEDDISYEEYGGGSEIIPAPVKMVGDRTWNLFDGMLLAGYVTSADFSTYGGTTDLRYKTIKVFLKAGTYTIKFGTPVQIVRFVFDNTIVSNVAIGKDVYTFTTQTDNYVGLGFRNYEGTDWDTKTSIMLNEGSTPLPYEPYGYRVPVVTKGKNLWDPNGKSTNQYGDDRYGVVLPKGTYTLTNNSDVVVYYRDYDESLGQINPNEIKTLTFAIQGIYWAGVSRTNIQLELGSTATPYEPYHPPITTNLYLPKPLASGEVLRSDGSREVKWGKYEFTGDERVQYGTTGQTRYNFTAIDRFVKKPEVNGEYLGWKCNSFKCSSAGDVYYGYSELGISNTGQIWILGTLFKNIDDILSFLKSQYEAGIPVTIYYPLAEPTTEQVTDLPAIPTIKGTTVIDVETEVKPSSVSLTYR